MEMSEEPDWEDLLDEETDGEEGCAEMMEALAALREDGDE